MSRRFVSDHASEFPVTRLCALVGVPGSSFYEWSTRPLSAHYFDDVDLAHEIYEIHVAARRTYGAPRVEGQLRHRGRCHSRKRVARIMAECGLVGPHSRRKWRRGRATTAPAPDLLKRDFTAERSDQRWVADITEFACPWVLSVVATPDLWGSGVVSVSEEEVLRDHGSRQHDPWRGDRGRCHARRRISVGEERGPDNAASDASGLHRCREGALLR